MPPENENKNTNKNNKNKNKTKTKTKKKAPMTQADLDRLEATQQDVAFLKRARTTVEARNKGSSSNAEQGGHSSSGAQEEGEVDE
ncbi:hypothetical protein CSAL01_06083 [Colletotrichum salicis]|uniref:Uncharacterized protein n=1 Tax=Colletotrichum salicis TaxID=1209931 RepID=A0A135TLR8_9PEZI|nr:hypothetical protein CSAL01_06083 [Colletotrichum salicis]